MFEKVNPSHPDKVADRIAGAIVDYAYSVENDPRIAVEVLIGHGVCHVIMETSVLVPRSTVEDVVERIVGRRCIVDIVEVPQDIHLASNQKSGLRCGDNGIFKGVPVSQEQRELSHIARELYRQYPSDGKYILDLASDRLIICQSNATHEAIQAIFQRACVNPLGDWTGGTEVDTGATNRKLGSDMGDAVTGGGLHGKDLSKADVSVNIYAHVKAQETGREVKLCCAIGDDTIDGKKYSEIVEIARKFIDNLGGFEKLAEWGLI